MEKKHKDYFEGILQLRNPNKEVMDFAINELEKKENASVTKIKKVPNGIDIYMWPQRFLRNLCSRLQNKFGGHVTISTKLHTKNRITSKEVHRVNALFRMTSFKRGDVIDYKGEKIKIINMHKKVLAKGVKTGKKLNLSFKDLIK